MRFTKKERALDAISLKDFGLLPEEIEGYFDYYDKIWSPGRPKRKTMIINSRKKADKTDG